LRISWLTGFYGYNGSAVSDQVTDCRSTGVNRFETRRLLRLEQPLPADELKLI
jgi:hypothetical protein